MKRASEYNNIVSEFILNNKDKAWNDLEALIAHAASKGHNSIIHEVPEALIGDFANQLTSLGFSTKQAIGVGSHKLMINW